MHIPTATYRLQFNKDFPFSKAIEIVPYLSALGISDVYASPIFKARAGSMHGYDVVDHNQIDPMLGGEAEFERFCAALKAAGLGLILDIVPNHMGISEPYNAWWMDVLENGPSSRYASYFDIDWRPVNPHLENKVLLPILEDQYGNVLEQGKLSLRYEDGAFFVAYYDGRYPVAPRTYDRILALYLESLTDELGRDHEDLLELQSIITAIHHLPPRTEIDPEKLEERWREKEVIKRRIAALHHDNAHIAAAIDRAVAAFNGDPADPHSFDQLDALMDDQAYRLAFWRVAGEEINYRRFFDINELAAIRTESNDVFRDTHALIQRLVAEGKVSGLRVDHPDGLWDPAVYFRRLQALCGAPEAEARTTASEARPELKIYVVAEKILAQGESLPRLWAVSGTTGYDFLSQVNGIFVRRAGRRAFDKIYADFIGARTRYRDLVNSRKKMIMLISLASEVNALSHQLDSISERDRHYRDFTLNSLTFVIREVVACLSVYRTYTSAGTGAVAAGDRKYIEAAVEEAKRRNPRTARALFDFIRDILLLQNLDLFQEADRRQVIDFVMRLQQLTGPVMAKAVEDTAFYIYNRLVSLNEVGGEPEQFGLSLDEFHRQSAARRRDWPDSLLATSTHDTKRSEDVRARINVLSELPAEWRGALARWRRMNADKISTVDGEPAPDSNDEYLLYQTLVGVWPSTAPSEEEIERIRGRVGDYMQKAIKEAKVHTSWVAANEAYDRAVDDFVRGILAPGSDNAFIAELSAFYRRVAYPGMLNSLGQTLIKISAPGVPDFYQGTEFWDDSLVDPDNRRPLDYECRRRCLDEIKQRAKDNLPGLLRELSEHWQDGRLKLYTIHTALGFRRDQPAIFQAGDYLPLGGAGPLRENICAFARSHQGQTVIAVVPRFVAKRMDAERLAPPPGMWEEAFLALPRGMPARWHNVLTKETVEVSAGGRQPLIELERLFAALPVALLHASGAQI